MKARELVVGRNSLPSCEQKKYIQCLMRSEVEIEHAHIPESRGASCAVSFTLDFMSWFNAEHAVCEPCHLTWSVHLSEESYERAFVVSISWSIGIPEKSMLDRRVGRAIVEIFKRDADPFLYVA